MKRFFSILLSFSILLISCSKYNSIELYEASGIDGEDFFKGMFFGANENYIPLKYINTIKEKKQEAISRMEEMKKSEPRIDIEQGLKEEKEFIGLIVSKIKEYDPEFFLRFDQEIKSKDHFRISEALKDASILLRKSLFEIPQIREILEFYDKNLNKINLEDFVDKNSGFDLEKFSEHIKLNGFNPDSVMQPRGVACVLAVAVAVAVVMTGALGVNYYAAVFVEKYFWGPDEEEQPAPASAIESIQFVDDQNSLRNQIIVNEIFEKI